VHVLCRFSFRLILLLLYTVAQLNVDDLTTTEIDKLNLCALGYKISAGYFGKLVPIHYHSTFVLSLWSTGLTVEPLLRTPQIKETSELRTKSFGPNRSTSLHCYLLKRETSVLQAKTCGPKMFVIERFHCIGEVRVKAQAAVQFFLCISCLLCMYLSLSRMLHKEKFFLLPAATC